MRTMEHHSEWYALPSVQRLLEPSSGVGGAPGYLIHRDTLVIHLIHDRGYMPERVARELALPLEEIERIARAGLLAVKKHQP
jgi:hypothetical protein